MTFGWLCIPKGYQDMQFILLNICEVILLLASLLVELYLLKSIVPFVRFKFSMQSLPYGNKGCLI